MRLTRNDDPYLTRMRDSLSVPGQSRRTRIKLIGSVTVLAIVLLIAGIRQWGDSPPEMAPDPVETARSAEPPATAPETERTVFGERPSPTDDVPTADSPKTERRSRSVEPPQSTSSVPADLQAFLDRWRTTLISGDAKAQAALYANRVDRFFTKRNVTRRDVLREKERMLARYPEFHKYDISDVQIESLDDSRAVVTFRKDWDARGRGRFAGSEQQRLTLRRDDGSWKIVREEETKIHWVRRS